MKPNRQAKILELIEQKDIEKMVEFAGKRGGLYGKLKDLGVLYQGFERYLGWKNIGEVCGIGKLEEAKALGAGIA